MAAATIPRRRRPQRSGRAASRDSRRTTLPQGSRSEPEGGTLGPILILGLILELCLGVGFALAATDRVRADGPFAAPAFVLVVGFAGVVVLPMTLYFFWAHQAWSWLYLLDPAKVPSLAVVPVAVTHLGTVVGGWYLGARLLRADRRTVALWVAGGGGGLLLLSAILLGGRIGRYGSYSGHSAGEDLRGLMDVKLGWALIVVFLAFAVAAGYVALELSRDSRRVRSR